MTEKSSTSARRPRLGLPLKAWIALFALAGGIVGLGTFTFLYAQGGSYLSDDPKACANCHIMEQTFDNWNRGTHKAVATCNDCHTPHDNIVSKYAVKAINGFNHSAAFTLDNFPEPIRITGMNRDVAQHNCLACHKNLVSDISHEDATKPTDCLQCHARVGHEK
jgi:cytochrome c nitrite reductase small subunit